MDYFRIELDKGRVTGFMTTSLQKQLVLFLISYKENLHCTLDCAEDVSGKGEYAQDKIAAYQTFLPY
jgi:hypothetical protein